MAFYERAIHLALDRGFNLLAQRAALYFMGEVVRLNPEIAETSLKMIADFEKNASANFFAKECKAMKQRIQESQKVRIAASNAQSVERQCVEAVTSAKQRLLDAAAKTVPLVPEAIDDSP